MYAVIVEEDGRIKVYGPFENRNSANAVALDLGGSVAVLYKPFHKNNTGDMYGREV